MDPLAELRFAVARLAERLDALAPEPPPTEEKLSLIRDIQSHVQCQGRTAAWRMYQDVVADGKLTQVEFDQCLQG